MPGLDDLAPLLQAVNGGRGGVSAPMPAAMPLPAPQIAQMPDLPMTPTPMRQNEPTGGPTRGGMPWGELIRQLAPVIGGLASGGRGPGATGFMQGFQRGSALAAQEQEKRKKESASKQQQAAEFRMEIFDQARQITDPSEWAKFVDMATDSALQMGLIQEPSEFKKFLEYPAHLEAKQKREAALSRLESLMKSGYDLDELAGQNASVQIPSGPRGAMETYKVRDLITIAGALPEAGGKFVSPPKKTDVPTDALGRYLASYAAAKGKKVTDLTPQEHQEARSQFDQSTTAVGSFEDYVKRYAAERNTSAEKLTATQIEDARKRYQQSDDRLRITPDTSWKKQGILTAQQAKFSAEPIVKAYNEIATKAQTIAEIVNGPQTGPGDLAIVFEFMKGLDPTSVVRETEFANAAKSGNIFKGVWAKFNGYLKESGGFLPPNVKKEFLRLVQVKLNAQTAQYNNLRKSYASIIDGVTGEPGTGAKYLVDYAGAFPTVEGSAGSRSGAAQPPRQYYDANGNPKK